MKWMKFVGVALKSIAKNRLRSLLTMLGIIIGVGSVICLISLGKGSQADIQRQVDSMGTNLLIIRSGSASRRGVHGGVGTQNSLSMADARAMNKALPSVAGVSPVISVQAQVIAGAANWNTRIQGVSTDYPLIRNLELRLGTFFSGRDVKVKSKVAVLGKTVVDELFSGQDPLITRIRIRNVPFKVIGVLGAKGQTAMGTDQDDVILIPSTTALYRLSDGKTVRTIMASATSPEAMDQAVAEIRALLRIRHRLRAEERDDFRIRSQTEITSMATRITGTLTLLLSAIAGVSLLVGGIGIMNIMLVSVTERTREIGIRMAVGARGRDILTQFLIEAMILSLLGGGLGIVLGLGIAFGLGRIMGTSVVVEPGIILTAVLFSAGVGIFFGFYPARKAASMSPINALKYE